MYSLGRSGALGALVVAGCASPPPPPVHVVIAPPPVEHIDGMYRGIARLMRATIPGCPRSGARIVAVEGNALSLTYRGATVSYALVATVAADGSIHGSDGRGSIEGRINGHHMDLTVASDYCEVRYALDRG